MCLAKAYLGDSTEFIMEDIAALTIENDKINLRTLFGEQKEVKGAVESVDFQNGRIVLRAAAK